MSALKGSRRKLQRAHESLGGIVDLGGMATPPSFPPLAYHTESDMRSAPNNFLPPHRIDMDHVRRNKERETADMSSDEGTVDHMSQPEQQSPTYPTWTPINDPSARPRKLPLGLADFSLRNGYTVTNAELRMNEIFEGEVANVDKQDGLVYHSGHKSEDHDGRGTSYSLVWLDDDPEALPLQVQQWKDRKIKAQRSLEGPALENAVRNMLETGSALILERAGSTLSSESGYECLLTECRYNGKHLPAGHFYLTLRPGRQAWQQTKPFFFCLTCFERLWMGNFNENPGPPGIRVQPDLSLDTRSDTAEPKSNDHRSDSPLTFSTPYAYTNELALDGSMDTLTVDDALRVPSLCSSRHAPPEITSSPLHQVIPEPEDVANDSPRSINTTGDWVIPPNRVQHISAFIKPGKTLSRRETAAVNLWKAASFEQLQWEVHQLRTKYRREYQEGEALIDRSLNMEEYQIEDIDGEVVDETAAEAIVKLPKSRFRGCSLADVWLVMKNEAA